jgi:hypothetical protein
MRFVQRIRDLPAEFQYLFERQRSRFQALGQSFALQALHHQIIDAVLVPDVVQHANVRMIELRDDLCFALKSLLLLAVRGRL